MVGSGSYHVTKRDTGKGSSIDSLENGLETIPRVQQKSDEVKLVEMAIALLSIAARLYFTPTRLFFLYLNSFNRWSRHEPVLVTRTDHWSKQRARVSYC